jgi:hypothetical protein
MLGRTDFVELELAGIDALDGGDTDVERASEFGGADDLELL